ncbi:MAG: hypothetical protein AAGE96_05420 [Cyanobacteria bacterium P01_G01_bin.19]
MLEQNPVFFVYLAHVRVTLENGEFFTIFAVDAVSQSDTFVIDAPDLFPRYYFSFPHAMEEALAWVECRKAIK